jgi:hypothetical protein
MQPDFGAPPGVAGDSGERAARLFATAIATEQGGRTPFNTGQMFWVGRTNLRQPKRLAEKAGEDIGGETRYAGWLGV